VCCLREALSCCVHSQEAVDSRNQMPREPNQQPCAGQRKVISTHRELSTIPKGGTDVTWLYPSPQMFYNGAHSTCAALLWPDGLRRGAEALVTYAALKRKGKGADVVEDDVAAVVHAHNGAPPLFIKLHRKLHHRALQVRRALDLLR